MKRFGTVPRVVAVFAVLFALSGMRSAAFAQDATGTPVAQDPATADTGATAAASYTVGVSCSPVGDGHQTACTFTGSASDGSAIEALWVPASVACSQVVDSGGAEWTGDGYHVMADTLTLTLTGVASPGGSAGYAVRVNGTPVDASGDGLVCSDAPATNTSNPTAPVTADVASTPQVTDGNASGGAPTDGAAGNGTGAASTPDATSSSSNDSVAAAAQVDVTVAVYNCKADPGSANPATSGDCTPADGVQLTATVGNGTPGQQNTSGGSAVFMATAGSSFSVSEAVPSGYHPIGNGSLTINSVDKAQTLVFVNVADDQQGNPQLGRMQIVHGSCPSSQPRDPKFIVIPPRSFMAAANEACAPTPGAELTITGGTLGGGGVQVITDDHGVWRGYLPPGEYTVSEAAGSQSGVPVVANDLTAVVVIDYSVPPRGTLTISKILCPQGDKNSSAITVSNQAPANDPSCGPVNGNFSLNDGSKEITFSVGTDGVASMSLPAGTYTLTDLDTGDHADVQVNEGATTYALSRKVQLLGSLVVRHYFCADPGASNQDPSNSAYFTSQCTEQTGSSLTLSGANGPVDTRSGNDITWSDLVPGAYTVAGDGGTCAVFVGSADVRGGFSVQANTTTHVSVYTCAASSDGGGSNSGGSGSGGDGSGSGGDGSNTGGSGAGDSGGAVAGAGANDAGNQTELASVTSLPDTGTVGSHGDDGLSTFELLVIALPALLAGVALRRRWAR